MEEFARKRIPTRIAKTFVAIAATKKSERLSRSDASASSTGVATSNAACAQRK